MKGFHFSVVILSNISLFRNSCDLNYPFKSCNVVIREIVTLNITRSAVLAGKFTPRYASREFTG